jgi:hypothetical protein
MKGGGMKAKTVVTIVLLAFVAVSVVYLVVKETGSRGEAENVSVQTADGTDVAVAAADSKVIVYYFHGNKRCNTCRTIEAYTAEAVNTGFAPQIESGRVMWQPVNIDEPENEHFVEDYEITTRTVVLVDVVEGREAKWTKLERVWDLTGDKEAFVDYITTNTDAYLAGRDG